MQTAAACVLAAALIAFGLWRFGWLGNAHRIVLACSQTDGSWELVDGARRNMTGILRADSRLGGRWVWLRWDVREQGRPKVRSMLLVAGDIAAIDLRRLVVRLRFALEPAVDAQVGMHARGNVGRLLRARP